MTKQLRVATVIAQLTGGDGSLALRGGLALDPDRFHVTLICGGPNLDEQHDSHPAILTGADAIKGARPDDLLYQAYSAGVEVIRIPSLLPGFAPVRDLTVLRTLGKLCVSGQYDTVHTHGSKAGVLGRIAAIRSNVPQIFHTVHGFGASQFQPAWRRGASVRIERRLGRRTDVLFAVGTSVAAEAVRRQLAPPDRIRTIAPLLAYAGAPHGPAARGLARRRLGLPAGLQLVGGVGGIDDGGIEDWIDALALVLQSGRGQDVWGVWIGDGRQRETMLSRARNRGVAQRIQVIEPSRDIAELLPALDVFAVSSRRAGLPGSLIDAIRAEVPVVATAIDAAPDVVIPGETGLLVAPGRPDLLATSIAFVLEDSVEAQRMATNAYALLDVRCRPEAVGMELERSYARNAVRRATKVRTVRLVQR
jgi:glycosyltransferase involved in cell wall biosynthesis